MSQSITRQLTLCADDFGQSDAINQGILKLLELQRLGAVSVMSQGAAWTVGAAALQDHTRTADIGLHLNLTHRFDEANYAQSLPAWLLRAPIGWIDSAAVRDSFRRQIDLFVKHLGYLPDYLDGHQHVHAFAGIRNVLLEVIAEYWQGTITPWVRAPDQLLDDGRVPLKAWVLRTATRGFTATLKSAGLPYNAGFAGVYALTPDANFAQLMQTWLLRLPANTLIMVHPAEHSNDTQDPIREARVIELTYLRGPVFMQQLQSAEVTLSRLVAAR
jgi:predicted glycoside hydrolase/deacetylase ChbG (UPF0249 family)